MILVIVVFLKHLFNQVSSTGSKVLKLTLKAVQLILEKVKVISGVFNVKGTYTKDRKNSDSYLRCSMLRGHTQ